jgi:hypothetical protein
VIFQADKTPHTGDASVRANFIESKHEIREFPENPDNELAYFDAFSTIYKWHPACIGNRAFRPQLSGGKAMPMTFKIDRLVRGDISTLRRYAQASRFYRIGKR